MLLRCIVAITVLALTADGCSSPWISNGNFCYLFHNISDTLSGMSWFNARQACIRDGGDLLSIEDSKEQSFITNIQNDYMKKQHYWIGLTDEKVEGTFVWSDGTVYDPTKFSNWRTSSGEPNNFRGNEDCAETSYDGRWNDNDCSVEFGFICKRKKDAVIPPPPTLPPILPPTGQPVTCEAGWLPWGTSCYGIIKGLRKSWDDARADCLRRFGDLLIIETKEEQEFLTNEVGLTENEYWIGLSDSYAEGLFFWVDKKPLTQANYSNWFANQPSNSFGGEDCVNMYGKFSPGQWNDDHCASLKDYICEKVSGAHNCPEGWISWGDYCYQINAHPNQLLSWDDANTECNSFNEAWKQLKLEVAEAHLVSITSQEEQDMLIKEFRKVGSVSWNSYFWIGLNDREKHNEYHWSDGSVLKYTNWITGQSHAATSNFHCVTSSFYLAHGRWSQEDCDRTYQYACKVKRGKDRCYDPLGMQSFEIPNSAITASGSLTASTPPYAARLYMKAGNSFDGAWCAEASNPNPWLLIDLGAVHNLKYMAIQGKANSDAMVTDFYVRTSLDGQTYDMYGDIPPHKYYLFRVSPIGRKSNDTFFSLPLPTPVVARYFQLVPRKWNIACCMRVELYGCKEDFTTTDCGVNWMQEKSSKNCYQVNTKATSWDAAQSICKAQGGDILSVTSFEELTFVKDQLKPMEGRYASFWIGLTDNDADDVYRWSDQSPTTIVNWYTGNPVLDDRTKNCVLMRAADGAWTNEACALYFPFVCKKKYISPYIPREPFNNHWISMADYYWPLNEIVKSDQSGSEVAGTVPGVAYGTFGTSNFPITGQNVLSFDGVSNYIRVYNLSGTCVHHPDSYVCPHGLTVSFNFKYTEPGPAATSILLDSLGQNDQDTLGYYVFIQQREIGVYLRSRLNVYNLKAPFSDVWNHFLFTWSNNNGMAIYINGIKRAFSLSGAANPNLITKEAATDIYVGKSASADQYMKIMISSLAFFERELSGDVAQDIYIAEFGKCKRSLVESGKFCYEFNATQLNFDEASKYCQSKGGNLMSVHSPVEQAVLAMNVGPYGLKNSVWLGLNSLLRDNVYNWTDGSPVTYTHWHAKEPNNFRVREDCVVAWNVGGWNDNPCMQREFFACKYNKVVSPAGQLSDEGDNYFELNYYASRTFGCTVGNRVQLKSVLYGDFKVPCLLDEKFAREVMQNSSQCSNGLTCYAQASDYFFKWKNPCTVFTRDKTLKVNYTCVEDPASKPSNEGCKDGYAAYRGDEACYKLFRQELSFDEANKQCVSDGGLLTTINSREHQVFLTSLLSTMYKASDIWIGMLYDSQSGLYGWINKEASITYTNWFNAQPDTRPGPCVKVTIQEGATESLFWKHGKCSERNAFMCRHLKAKATEVPITTGPDVMGVCPTNWTRYQNKCIIVNPDKLNYMDALVDCQQMGKGASLVSISNWLENDVVSNATYQAFANPIVWIGLSNRGTVKGFGWEDGAPVQYIKWDAFEPSTTDRHLCVLLQGNGYWRDQGCDFLAASVCQMPVDLVVLPTTPVITSATPTQDPTVCLPNWKLYDGNCYFFGGNDSFGLDWHQAKRACESFGASLVSIRSKEENAFVAEEVKRRISVNRALIGLNDLGSERVWQWTDGSVVDYINWEVNQPDDWHGMEDCVEIRNGAWNDVACNREFAFVCKMFNSTVKVQTSVSPPTAKPDTGFCRNGWVNYGSSCYLFNFGEGNRRNFEDADGFCRSFGDKSFLASVHSNYENSFILSQLYNIYEPMYIGLSDRQVEGKFIWTDQSSVTYVNWYSRQPSQSGDEDCVEILPYFKFHGRWNDIVCQNENGFVCEEPSHVTQPTDPAIGSPTPAIGPVCPSGYKKYQGHCYVVKTTIKTWTEALEDCRKDHDQGNLVSLHSPAEQAFLFSFFAEYASETWIGLRRNASSTEFVWSDNSPYDFMYWQTGKAYVPFGSEACVSQEMSNSIDGQWKVNLDCKEKKPYACKITYEIKEKVTEYPGTCGEGWSKLDKYCYKLFAKYDEREYMPEARSVCRSQGGDLVSIHSKQEQDLVHYLIRDELLSVYIGLNDRQNEHQFEWSDSSPLDFKNWAPTEPNDASGSENCVEVNPNSGLWNDISCFRKLPFVCKKSLECGSSLGVANSSVIPDESFNSSTVQGRYYAKFARISADTSMAWCANKTDRNPYLQVDLGATVSVTRINTQGLTTGTLFTDLTRNYVISYTVAYSDDGISFLTYLENGRPKVFPGNSDAKKVEGVLIDPPVVARFVRVNPVTYRGNICLRVDMSGCPYTCESPLGMEDGHITDKQITASSAAITRTASQGRLTSVVDGNAWCASVADDEQWLQIDLASTVQVTKVATQGRLASATDSSDQVVRAYSLSFSDDAKIWRRYKSYTGDVRIFSGNRNFASSVVFHRLNPPDTGRYIRFVPLEWTGSICMKVEVYGCPYECDSALGVADSQKIPDGWLSGSSVSSASHAPAQGRLNRGAYNEGAWCAAVADSKQYLQVAFPSPARISYIATQGFDSDNAAYVTKYRIQFSSDGSFWETYSYQKVVQEFDGNNNGRDVNKVSLPTPIVAKFLRVNPTQYRNSVCLRLELYGCPLEPFVIPTEAPRPRKKYISGSIKINSVEFIAAFKDTKSIEFLTLAHNLEKAITDAYIEDFTFREGFESVQVNSFSPGSVIANFVMVLATTDRNLTTPLEKAVRSGRLGEFSVDPKSLRLQEGPGEPEAGKATEVKSGLSNGGKIGLIVFFVFVIVVMLVGGLVYYYKKRGRLVGSFKHESFQNPVHMQTSEDELNMDFGERD